MAYRIGENLSVSQVFRDLYDFLTQMVTIYDTRYDAKGDGYLKDLSFYSDKAKTETWTLKYKKEDSDGNAVFSVSGSVSGTQDDIHSNNHYDNGIFQVTLTNGDTEWQDGDIITWKTKEVTDPQWEVMTKYEKFGYIKTKSGHIARPPTSLVGNYLISDKKYEDKLASAVSFPSNQVLDYSFGKDNDETNNIGSKKFSLTYWLKDTYQGRPSVCRNRIRNSVAIFSSDDRTLHFNFTPSYYAIGDGGQLSRGNLIRYTRVDTGTGGHAGDDYVKVDDDDMYVVGMKVITSSTRQILEIKDVNRDDNIVYFTGDLSKDMNNDEYLKPMSTYDPTKFNLFTATFDTVTREMVLYINKYAIFRDIVTSRLAENEYQMTGFLGQEGSITDLAQWNKVLSLDEVRDLYDSPTSIDITSDNIIDAPILSREAAVMGWVLKSTHQDLSTDLFIWSHPYPYSKDRRQPSVSFQAGYKYLAPLSYTAVAAKDGNVNFNPAQVEGRSPIQFDGMYDRDGGMGYAQYRGGIVGYAHGVDYSKISRLGLLTRDPEERITKYWFISDGKTVIVCLKIFDDVNTDKKVPVYQTMYLGDTETSGSRGYTYVVASTHNGQDYWYNNDSNFCLKQSLYYTSIGGFWAYSLNNLGRDQNYINRSEWMYYRNNEDVVSGNYSIYPLYVQFRPYHSSCCCGVLTYPQNIRFFYMYWAATKDLKAEDTIYVDGHECVVVADGNNSDRLIVLNLDTKEG